MARHQLTDSKIKAAKFTGKPTKLWDGGGLYLHLLAATRTWRVKYRVGTKERDAKIGRYPALSLADARRLALEIERKVAMGIDPEAEARETEAAKVTFEDVCREWFSTYKVTVNRKTKRAPTPETAELVIQRLERWALPVIGRRPMVEITREELERMVANIKSAGKSETALRVARLVEAVFRSWAKSAKRHNSADDLHKEVGPVARDKRAAITGPAEFGRLLRDIDSYGGQHTTKAALKLIALTFVRPGELRGATWGEIDEENAVWRIPGRRMKQRNDLLVPLAAQTLGILEWLRPLTDRGPESFLLPAIGPRPRPISENTITLALRRMDYGPGQMCAHGFRTSASTMLHERGWPSDVIELQLAHAVPGVKGIYNRAARLEERREMMQDWADYLDTLREGAKVVPIRGRR